MRVYKLLDKYIDLDHVLAVNELDLDPYSGGIVIHMAFRDAPVYVSYQNQWAIEKAVYADERVKPPPAHEPQSTAEHERRCILAEKLRAELFRAEYDKFLAAWRGDKASNSEVLRSLLRGSGTSNQEVM
jgi:hypothetical protein